MLAVPPRWTLGSESRCLPVSSYLFWRYSVTFVYVVDLIGTGTPRIETDGIYVTEQEMIFKLKGKESARYKRTQVRRYRDVTDQGIPFDQPFLFF